MTTKIEHVNDAYSKLRISGLTVNPSSSDLSLALNRLENMMAELEDGKSLCVNYNFEETPDGATESGVKRSVNDMISSNLAVLLSPDFNKQIPITLSKMASKSFSAVSAMVATENIRQVQAPSRMPIGSGNSRGNRTLRFNTPTVLPDNNCYTRKLKAGDINDYTESFAAYLGDETIASYTIVPSSGLTVVSSSSSTLTITYRINAVTVGYQTAILTITTSSGRVEARTIEFEVY